uniref:Uncharacterized protein n=1 Tax=uncultured bacterium Csd4 TaxID=1637487 RepID=A0A0F6YT20_9BACT|nr:putative uncharacterized protein [uncultured bacterium Csd4]
MRLVFTLFISFVLGVSCVSAQDFPLQFADANGNIIADGTELTLDQPTVEVSEFDDAIMILSGVFVLNTTANDVNCGTEYSITQISNGDLQTCFPSSCIQRNKVGSWTSEVGVIHGNELKNMQTEWIPQDAGTLNAEFRLLKYKLNPVTNKYTVESNGPLIKMHFVYDPAAIRALDSEASDIASVAYYSLDGRRVASPTHGIYMMKVTYTNGRTVTTKHLF